MGLGSKYSLGARLPLAGDFIFATLPLAEGLPIYNRLKISQSASGIPPAQLHENLSKLAKLNSMNKHLAAVAALQNNHMHGDKTI